MNATFSLKTSFSSNYIWELSRVRPPLEVRQVCCIYSSKQIYLSLVSLFHRSCAVVAIWLVSLTMALPKVTYIDFSGGCTWSVGQNKWLYFLVPAFLVYYVASLLTAALSSLTSIAAGARWPPTDATRKLLRCSLVPLWFLQLAGCHIEFVNVLSPHVI